MDISHNPELTSLKSMGGKEFPYLSILRTLDLKTLNVSHTGLFGIMQLSQLGLKEINMANTRIKYFPGLNEFTVKPTIYVSRSQNLSKCPKDIKVIYVD